MSGGSRQGAAPRADRRSTAPIFCVLAAGLSVAAQQSALHDTYEWLGECRAVRCPYGRDWVAPADTPAWPEPRAAGIPASESPLFTVRAGERVRAVTGVLYTVERGTALMREDFSTDASYGNLSTQYRQTITLREGETVHLLAPKGPETYRIWRDGRVLDAHLYRVGLPSACARPEACAGVITKEPVTRWWVMVMTARREVGWVEEPRGARE